MKGSTQKFVNLAKRTGVGLALAAAMVWFAPGRAGASSQHKAHAKKHVFHATAKKAVANREKKASVQRVSYGYKKAAVRKRHVRRRWHRHHITLPSHPSHDRTEEIQAALARGGYYTGDPNGKWDSRMSEALERFQAAKGLTPTGKLDALSLEKMGLGSDVAGVSAPRAITPGNPDASSSTASSKAAPKTPGL